MKTIIKNSYGFTLIEMVIAISVFSVVVVVTADMFLSMLNSQRRSVAIQTEQESMRYVFEVMSKEIRHAQRSDTDCRAAATNRIYNVNEAHNELYFKNKNGECVSYALIDGVLMVRRNARVASTTPTDMIISGLTFNVRDNNINAPENPEIQPRVTFKMKAQMKFINVDLKDLYLETTVVSRYYE